MAAAADNYPGVRLCVTYEGPYKASNWAIDCIRLTSDGIKRISALVNHELPIIEEQYTRLLITKKNFEQAQEAGSLFPRHGQVIGENEVLRAKYLNISCESLKSLKIVCRFYDSSKFERDPHPRVCITKGHNSPPIVDMALEHVELPEFHEGDHYSLQMRCNVTNEKGAVTATFVKEKKNILPEIAQPKLAQEIAPTQPEVLPAKIQLTPQLIVNRIVKEIGKLPPGLKTRNITVIANVTSYVKSTFTPEEVNIFFNNPAYQQIAVEIPKGIDKALVSKLFIQVNRRIDTTC